MRFLCWECEGFELCERRKYAFQSDCVQYQPNERMRQLIAEVNQRRTIKKKREETKNG